MCGARDRSRPHAPGPAFALALSLSVCSSVCLSTACDGDGATQVVVVLEADPTIEAEATRLGVEIVSQNGDRTQRSVTVGETDAHRWPFRVPIVPLGGDVSRRVLVVAEAVDAEGESLGVQRAHLSFERGATRYVTLRFTTGCRQRSCDTRTTCREGACASACVTPAASEGEELAPGPCIDDPRGDAGLDAGQDSGSADGGPIDGGPIDGGPIDGGLPTPPCPTTSPGAFVEGFEALDALPRCGVPPCETSPSGRVEVVESGSVLAPPAPPLCGGRALRLVRFESPSKAFFVAPVEAGAATYLRAWLWLEEGDGQRVSVLGLSLGDAYRSNDRDGVELSWEPGGAALVTRWAFVEAETPLGDAAPRAGGWRCVELGVEPATGRAWAGADGARVELELDAELAEAFAEAESAHARVGLFETPTAGREGTAFVDEVVVSATPIGCPVR